MGSLYERIYSIVRKIPKGRVATYGQIAEIAGIPREARRVGYALSALPEDSDVPWQRVINAKGGVSERPFAARQRYLLEGEGVIFHHGIIELQEFQWQPLKEGR